jgi:hypothetical protein
MLQGLNFLPKLKTFKKRFNQYSVFFHLSSRFTRFFHIRHRFGKPPDLGLIRHPSRIAAMRQAMMIMVAERDEILNPKIVGFRPGILDKTVGDNVVDLESLP